MQGRGLSSLLLAAACAASCGPVVETTGASAANRPPEIRSILIEPAVLNVGGSATITVDAVDPDAEPLLFRFTAGAGQIARPDPAQPNRAVYVHDGGPSVADVIVVSVTDTRNATASRSAELRLRRNTPPTVTVRSTGSCHPRCTVTFTADAVDDPEDTLTYSWRGCSSGTQRSLTCEITAPVRVSATVIVDDGRGGVTTAFGEAEGTNQPPIITGGGQVRGVPATLRVTRRDPDDDETQCGWTGDCMCTGNNQNFDLVCDMAPTVGACTMVFRCFDPFGARAETTFNLAR